MLYELDKLTIIIVCGSIVVVVVSLLIIVHSMSPLYFFRNLCSKPYFVDESNKTSNKNNNDSNNGQRGDMEQFKFGSQPKQLICYGKQTPAVPNIRPTFLESHKSTKHSIPEIKVTNLSHLNGSSNEQSTLVNGNLDTPKYLKYLSFVNEKTSKLEILEDTPIRQNLMILGTGPCAVSFSAQYDPEHERLTLYVSHVANLETNFLNTLNDSYVEIFVIRHPPRRFSFMVKIDVESLEDPIKYGSSVEKFCTKIVRRSCNPVFNEYFHVENLMEKDKKSTFIKLITCSTDKYSQRKIIGHCSLNLDKFNFSSMKHFTVLLEQFNPDLGEILLTLAYLPTSERLNVNIIKVTNLRSPTNTIEINPFVKLVLLQKGKSKEKHSTSVHYECNSVVFNEQFFFNVPSCDLNKVVLLCAVYHRQMQETEKERSQFNGLANISSASKSFSITRDELSNESITPTTTTRHKEFESFRRIKKLETDSSMGRRSTTSLRSFRQSALNENRRSSSGSIENVRSFMSDAGVHSSRHRMSISATKIDYPFLGRVVLGACVKGSGKSHWLEIMNNPRKQVVQTHKLQQ